MVKEESELDVREWLRKRNLERFAVSDLVRLKSGGPVMVYMGMLRNGDTRCGCFQALPGGLFGPFTEVNVPQGVLELVAKGDRDLRQIVGQAKERRDAGEV